MKNLTTQPAQVGILNSQIFTTEYVAKRYGVSVKTIGGHKQNHADEILENIHFIYETQDTKGGKQEVLKWTLRGIIKLGMFIRSKEAKNFRLWAEMELEKSILQSANELSKSQTALKNAQIALGEVTARAVALKNDNAKLMEQNESLNSITDFRVKQYPLICNELTLMQEKVKQKSKQIIEQNDEIKKLKEKLQGVENKFNRQLLFGEQIFTERTNLKQELKNKEKEIEKLKQEIKIKPTIF